jgi:hypothetical protein
VQYRCAIRAAQASFKAAAAVLFLLAAVRVAGAQAPSATASPVVKAELEPLVFFSGQWDCAG